MSEKFRPLLHFAPRSGWMNDPNGMVLVDGAYHLFFQHDPNSVQHGPMHWGHAISTDLVTWTERPVALHPTDLGVCFSGSAIETDDGEIKLFYTSHLKTADGKDYQTQCLVHADRGLNSFTPQPGNPVLGNPGFEVFRDPKVIWHEPSKRWIMPLTHGQSIGIYSSSNLKDWTFESTFGEAEGRHSRGVWECPDLLPLIAPDGKEHWVLLVGISAGAYEIGSGTQYFVGQFDGHTFVNANAPKTELWLDFGRDYYAAQTFFDRSGGVPIALAWASNWDYARQTPTEAFRGVMSLPRELGLERTASGLNIRQSVPASVRNEFFASPISSGVYGLVAAFDLAIGQDASITLFGEAVPHFVFTRIAHGTATIRSRRHAVEEMNDFAHDYLVELAYPKSGPLRIELYVDRGVVELAANDGLVWITNIHFPERPEGTVTVRSKDEVLENPQPQLASPTRLTSIAQPAPQLRHNGGTK